MASSVVCLLEINCCVNLDVIIPYLRSSVDSPIASQCESTRTSNDADGDASISDLLSDVSYYYYCYLCGGRVKGFIQLCQDKCYGIVVLLIHFVTFDTLSKKPFCLC